MKVGDFTNKNVMFANRSSRLAVPGCVSSLLLSKRLLICSSWNLKGSDHDGVQQSESLGLWPDNEQSPQTQRLWTILTDFSFAGQSHIDAHKNYISKVFTTLYCQIVVYCAVM
jgi:hypothetical protein